MKSSALLVPLLLATAAATSPFRPLSFSHLLERTTSQNATFDERSGVLTDPSAGDASLDRREWFTASVGLMLERDVLAESGKMQKRAAGAPKKTRDLWSEEIQVGFDKRGNFAWPEKWDEVKMLVKRTSQKAKNAAKKKAATAKAAAKKKAANPPSINLKLATAIPKFNAIITWYTGVDLLNPYCADGSGWAPTDNSMVAAVTEQWGKNRPACGSYLQLRAPGSSKSIIVRVVDLCGGCAPGVPHVDLSQAAFKALYALDIGLVKNIQVTTLAGTPSNSWSSSLKRLYGPKVL